MTIRELYEGAAILLRYTDGGHEVCAEHDAIYASGKPPEAMDEGDVVALKKLGWRWDEGLSCWSHFT